MTLHDLSVTDLPASRLSSGHFIPITSNRHPQVLATVELHQKQARDSSHRILVEGPHPVEEALKAGLVMDSLFALDSLPPEALASCLARCTGSETEVGLYRVSEGVMRKLSTTSSPPPLLGVFHHPGNAGSEDEDELQISVLKATDWVLLLDSLQDPGNLGTLLRSAAAFGTSRVILTGSGVDPFHPKVIRATAGLLFRLSISSIRLPLAAVLEQLHQQGAALFLTSGARANSTLAPVPYHQARFTAHTPAVLVLGSEGTGLPNNLLETLAASERVQCVTIAMELGVDSLNVAVSGSILLAQAALQRQSE